MLISVLTPTFNRRANFLPRCLATVAAQVGDEFSYEHIVVDDCSIDGTWEYLRSVAESDPRVMALRTDANRRQGHAFNRALEVAQGDLVVPLDDDDLLLPRSLQMHHEFMAAHPEVAWSFGQAIAIDGDDRLRDWPAEGGFFSGPYSDDPAEFFECLLRRNTVIGNTVVIRRDALVSVGGWDEKVACQDWGLWLRLSHAGHQHARRRTYLSCLRIHHHQLTTVESVDGTYDRDQRYFERLYARR